MAILGLTGHAKTSKNIGIIDMNDGMKGAFGYGMAFGVLVGAIPMIMIGSWLTEMDYKRAAIEAKVGEYDSQTGVFKYKIMEEDNKK